MKNIPPATDDDNERRLQPLKNPVYVTSPFMPPIDEYISGLKDIWQNRQLTNGGPVLQRFTRSLSEFIGSDDVCLFSNGTLALQLGLQGLNITGEVITTPFTFVATSHALVWNQITPVFCDIEPTYYTLDPDRVEAAITPSTTAILAVHVYGNPCDHVRLADIARRHNLRLIYDSAHAFGVRVDGRSIAHYGDMSMFSFHATKLFHSLEGGMLVTADRELRTKVNFLKNFGFKNETEVVMTGTNAKMNEMQALMGLCVLDHVPELIGRRRTLSGTYRKHLGSVPGIKLSPPHPDSVEYNYAYFTIEVDAGEYGMDRDQLFERLKTYNIFTRRYFYPLLCDLECYREMQQLQPLDVARGVATRILTLPLYADLEDTSVVQICHIIRNLQNDSD